MASPNVQIPSRYITSGMVATALQNMPEKRNEIEQYCRVIGAKAERVKQIKAHISYFEKLENPDSDLHFLFHMRGMALGMVVGIVIGLCIMIPYMNIIMFIVGALSGMIFGAGLGFGVAYLLYKCGVFRLAIESYQKEITSCKAEIEAEYQKLSRLLLQCEQVKEQLRAKRVPMQPFFLS